MLSAYKSNFYVSKTLICYFFVFQLFLVFLGHYNQKTSSIIYSVFLATILPASMSEKLIPDSFTAFLICSPVSRKNMVLGRYLYIFTCYSFILFASLIIMVILGDVTIFQAFNLFLAYVSICTIFMSMSVSITYILKPKYMAIGVLISSILFVLLLFLIIACILFFISTISDEALYHAMYYLNNFLDYPVNTAIIFIISIIALYGSISISVKSFMKKEF